MLQGASAKASYLSGTSMIQRWCAIQPCGRRLCWPKCRQLTRISSSQRRRETYSDTLDPPPSGTEGFYTHSVSIWCCCDSNTSWQTYERHVNLLGDLGLFTSDVHSLQLLVVFQHSTTVVVNVRKANSLSTANLVWWPCNARLPF